MKRLVIALGIMLLFSVKCFGTTDVMSAAEEMYPYLGEDGSDAARHAENGEGFDLNRGLSRVIGICSENFMPLLFAGIKTAAKLMLCVLLISLADSLFFRGKGSGALDIAATAAIAMTGLGDVTSLLNVAIGHQNRLSEFSKILLPFLTAAGAASGRGGESLMLQSGIAMFCDLAVSAFSGLYIPFIFAYIALGLGGSLCENSMISKLGEWLKNFVNGGIRIFMTLFLGYMTISGAAGRAADSLALRSAKTAAASVPYIGGVASEAADAVVAGASVMKGYLGVFGTVGILGSAVVPLLSCGLGWGCVKLASMLASGFSRGEKAVEIMADAMGLIFAMCAASTFLMLLALTVCVNTVSV